MHLAMRLINSQVPYHSAHPGTMNRFGLLMVFRPWPGIEPVTLLQLPSDYKKPILKFLAPRAGFKPA